MFHFQVQKVSQPPSAGRPGGGPVWRDWNLVQTIGKAWHGRLGDREVDLYSKAEPRSGPVLQDRNLVPKIEDSWNEVLLPYTWFTLGFTWMEVNQEVELCGPTEIKVLQSWRFWSPRFPHLRTCSKRQKSNLEEELRVAKSELRKQTHIKNIRKHPENQILSCGLKVFNVLSFAVM